MIKNAMLITNDEATIRSNQDLIHIENSLYMARDLIPRLKYVIIDYDTLLVEESLLTQLMDHKDKLLILGDGFVAGLPTISKEDFHAENINLYYEQDDILDTTDTENMDESLEIDRIINLYVQSDTLVAEVEQELLEASHGVRKGVYKVIPQVDGGKMIKTLKWNSPIRMEYTLSRIKK